MSLKSIWCLICGKPVNVDPDGTVWPHGYVDKKKIVRCVSEKKAAKGGKKK